MTPEKVIERMRALGGAATARPWYSDARDARGTAVYAHDGRVTLMRQTVAGMRDRRNSLFVTTSANLHDLVWGAGGLVESSIEGREALCCLLRAIANTPGDAVWEAAEREFAAIGIKDGFGKRLDNALTALFAAAGEEVTE